MILLSSVFLIAGCQSTVQFKYDENDSKALNYAKAGGIDIGIQDAELPKDTVDKVNNGVLSGALHGTVGYLTASTINLTDTTGLILGFLSGVSEAKNPSERTALFALMPSHLAEDRSDAAKKMTKITEESMAKAFNDFNVDATYIDRHSRMNIFTFAYGGDKVKDCLYFDDNTPMDKVDEMCFSTVTIQKPYLIEVVNSEWLTNEPSIYYFSASKGHLYNKIILNTNNKVKPQTGKLMALLSKHLPEWAYIYVAPKDLLDDDGEQIEYPYILNQGQTHYFVKAASNS
ncbi:hypothetical protein OURE66S_01862 [Oligella ureolytica]